MRILVVNGGSSSFKFSLFEVVGKFTRAHQPIWKKNIEFKTTGEDRKEAIKKALLEAPAPIDRIGHRIVHGGLIFQKPTVINSEAKKVIEELAHLAPLHNPVNLEGIEITEMLFPQALQIGIFDTAFHSTLPEVAYTYPIPLKWREDNIRRYGFHGISHQYNSETVQSLIGEPYQKMISCHLGNGASCTAILNGKSVDTTMGFTPMEGLMMGTRSGSIDPGILLYLQREKGFSAKDLDHALNKESGLLGIGGSYDMREICAKKSYDLQAKLAFDLFIFSLKKTIGALSVSLGGLDVLSFTAGIGENSSEVREKTLEGLALFGGEIDQQSNINSDKDRLISSPNSKIKIYVIHAREDWLIAKECSEF